MSHNVRPSSAAEVYTLINRHGVMAKIATLGAAVRELWVPDRWGKTSDIVLGFADVEQYWINEPYFGVTIGRYANRIAGAEFSLRGRSYRLDANDGDNCLHGGSASFARVLWQVVAFSASSIKLSYVSRDGDGGFPGNLKVMVTYTLSDDNALQIDYQATSDQLTVINITNHSYFNLAGSGTILDHRLQLRADHYLPVDAQSLPTGEILPVAGTAFDFREESALAKHMMAIPRQPPGYDHTFVLSEACQRGDLAAQIYEPSSGRRLELYTTEPGVQLYTANYFDGSCKGKGGKAYVRHAGVCLETQHFPDSVHHGHFPSTILEPQTLWRSSTRWVMSAN